MCIMFLYSSIIHVIFLIWALSNIKTKNVSGSLEAVLNTVRQITANHWIFDWLHMHIVLRKIFSLANTKDERNSELEIGFARWNWITVEWVSLSATSNRLSSESFYNPLPHLYLSRLLRYFSSRIYMSVTICSFNPLPMESSITRVVCADRCFFLFKFQ